MIGCISEIRAQLVNHGMRIELAGFERDRNGVITHRAQPLHMAPTDGDGISFVGLDTHAGGAQLLMDDLWRCGIRPSEGAGSAGHAAATERHLKCLDAMLQARCLSEQQLQAAVLETLRNLQKP